MKQKRKHILKKLLIFGIAFMLASCSEELFDEAIDSSNKTSIKEIRFNELYQDSKFKNLIEKVSHTSNAARTSFENQNGFTISDGFVKVIETDSVISYTMLIERDVVTDTISFENLVIYESKFNLTEKAFSIKYIPTIITPSADNSFSYQGTAELNTLAFTGFNRAESNANATESDCYVEILMCNNEGIEHVAGDDCITPGKLYKKQFIVPCDEDDVVNNSSGSSGSGSLGSDNTGAPQGSSGPGNTGGSTSPVKPDQGFGVNSIVKTPCNELLAKDLDSTFNAKMIELKTKAANQGYESAYGMNQNAGEGLIIGSEMTGNPNGPLKGREIKLEFASSIYAVALNSIGFIHCHLDNGTTYKVFSLSDILALDYVANISTRPKEEITIYVVTSSGTFAIKVNDRIKLRNSAIYLSMMKDSFEEEFNKKIKKTDNVDKQKLGFVKFINGIGGLGANGGVGDIGIDMYEKDNTGKWNKLSLSSNGNSIVNKPCN